MRVHAPCARERRHTCACMPRRMHAAPADEMLLLVTALLTYDEKQMWHKWRTPTPAAKFHHGRKYVNDGDIIVRYISGKLNPADVQTKPLPGAEFHNWRRWMGVLDEGESTFDVAVVIEDPMDWEPTS